MQGEAEIFASEEKTSSQFLKLSCRQPKEQGDRCGGNASVEKFVYEWVFSAKGRRGVVGGEGGEAKAVTRLKIYETPFCICVRGKHL